MGPPLPPNVRTPRRRRLCSHFHFFRPPLPVNPPPPPTRLARRTRKSPHVTHTTRAVALTRGLCPQGGWLSKRSQTGASTQGERCWDRGAPWPHRHIAGPCAHEGALRTLLLGGTPAPPRESLCTPVQAHPPNRRAPRCPGRTKRGLTPVNTHEDPKACAPKNGPTRFPRCQISLSPAMVTLVRRGRGRGGGPGPQSSMDTELAYTPSVTGIWSPPRLSLCSVLPWGVQGGGGARPSSCGVPPVQCFPAPRLSREPLAHVQTLRLESHEAGADGAQRGITCTARRAERGGTTYGETAIPCLDPHVLPSLGGGDDGGRQPITVLIGCKGQ